VDNISVDNEGRLWIASHPKLYTFSLSHARDASKSSPSQVILVEPDASGVGGKVDQVYLSDGKGFSGASVAVHDGNQMIMGAVFEDGLRVCQLPSVWKHSESAPARRLVDPLRDEQIKEDEKKASSGS
jgi:arylesterase / paraoxonase